MPTLNRLAGELLVLDAARPLDLTASPALLHVRRGAVNVFAAEPGGRRHFLFRAEAGDILLGLPPVGDCRILAIGTLGAEAVQQPARSTLAALPAAERERTLARWRQLLSLPDAATGPLDALPELHRQAADGFAARLAAQAGQRRQQIRQAWRNSVDAYEDGLNGLAEVVRAAGERPAAPVTTIPADETPALLACRRVAAALDIPLRLSREQGRHNDVETLLADAGVSSRTMLLRGEWWRQENGPLIGFGDDGLACALLPAGPGQGYRQWLADGSAHPIDAARAQALRAEALMLYRPLPATPLDIAALLRFGSRGLAPDLGWLLLMGLLAALLAMLVPVATGMLVESVIPRGAYLQHWQLVAALLAAALGAAGFELSKAFALLRCEGRLDLTLQSALFDRLLRLPVGFFKQFTVGDLADRALAVQEIRETLSVTALGAVLGALFSLVGLGTMLFFSWRLSLIGLGLVLAVLLLTFWVGRRQLRHEAEQIRHRGRVEGLVLQFVVGIGKLRAAAAEPRAVAAWSRAYLAQKERFAAARRCSRVQELVQTCVPLLASLLIFMGMVWLLREGQAELRLQALTETTVNLARPARELSKPASAADLLAFHAAFGQFLAAMIGMTLAATKALEIVPLFRRLEPLLQTAPEGGTHRQPPAMLRGGIEFADVSFRYAPDGPPILDRVSFRIEPGQFVAVVGPSGSGKSTLIRLMMGFETPDAGDVFFDGQPLGGLDLSALRRRIGVVLQHGRIAAGSLFSNIAGTRRISHEEAMEAARQVGLDADIDAMPMGLHTVLQDGGGTLSGGQRQRLLMARALAQKPALLLLDEATSALDNRTQATVMDSLARLALTRVVVAHRLSTVKSADQILVVQHGRIVQRGRYDTLIREAGPFAELARRQLL